MRRVKMGDGSESKSVVRTQDHGAFLSHPPRVTFLFKNMDTSPIELKLGKSFIFE